MEKGEAQQQPDSDKDTTMSPADLEAAESMLANSARRQQSQYYPSSKGKGRGKGNKTRTHGVEMTAYSAVSVSEDAGPDSQRASGSEPTRQGGVRTSTAAAAAGTSRVRGLAAVGGGGGGRGGPGVYEEETVGLTEESLTDSPSSAAGVSTSPDDHRAGLLGKPARPVLARGGSSSSSRKSVASSSLSFSNGTGGHHKSNGHAKETGVVARGEYNDEHRRVRRRALSSPSSPRHHDSLARSGSFSSEGEGEGFLSGKGGGGRGRGPALGVEDEGAVVPGRNPAGRGQPGQLRVVRVRATEPAGQPWLGAVHLERRVREGDPAGDRHEEDHRRDGDHHPGEHAHALLQPSPGLSVILSVCLSVYTAVCVRVCV